MNNIKNSIYLALNALKTNKGRTILTVLGIVIGITAVIAVLSTGQAIKGLILGEIEAFGTDFIQVEVKTPNTSQQSTENAFSMVGGSVITTMKEKDVETVAKHPNISNWYAATIGQEIISYKSEIKKAMIFGTNEGFIKIDQSEVEEGRFFTEEENKSLAKVVVLGPKVKEKLFADQDAIGQSVKIGKEKFRVIGIMEERGASFSFDMDNMVLMPLRTLQKRLLGIDHISYYIVKLIDNNQAEQTAEDIIAIMREEHNITDPNKDDFAVTTMDQMMEMIDVIIIGMQFLLVALGSISLIVGGVGIMNIMYVSVTERTFEIGLRKSVGATRKNILWQFLSEAVILTFIGAIIGIILGISFSFLISIGARAAGFDWTFAISWSGLLLAVVMSSAVGLIFGIYPARKAAAMDPIVALRQE